MDSQVSSQVHASRKKKWDIFIDNRLLDVTQLALTQVGWPNGEKLATPISQLGASYTTRQIYFFLQNNQINAHALIGQSGMGYCADKPMEKLCVF